MPPKATSFKFSLKLARSIVFGSGSNGTVETPDGRLDASNDDKAPHWWGKLTEDEQRLINDAYVREYGEGV